MFHLMRVAEHGLRALARKQRITLKRNRPIEQADWNEILSALEARSKHVENSSRSAKRDADLEFYKGLILSLSGFKDGLSKPGYAHPRQL